MGTAGTAAVGQDQRDWQSLTRLQPGETILLSLKTGAVKGTFQNWTPQDLRAGKVTAQREEVLQVAQVGTPQAVDHVELRRMRVQFLIQPYAVVERHPIHHQSVAVPLAGVVPVPGRIRIFRMTTAVQVDLMEAGAVIVRDEDQV